MPQTQTGGCAEKFKFAGSAFDSCESDTEKGTNNHRQDPSPLESAANGENQVLRPAGWPLVA
jgi:hypothetical protein